MSRSSNVALGIALLCSASPVTAGEPTRGAELLAPYKRGLQGALRAGLAKGAVGAIGACRVEAPALAEAHSSEGVRVGRTSHRLRNPANTAPDWVSPVLHDYLAGNAVEPREIQLGEGRAGYVEPTLTQPLCLTCHGAALAPEVASRIQELYPDDQAVGFEAGDLRGVFWVEYPAR